MRPQRIDQEGKLITGISNEILEAARKHVDKQINTAHENANIKRENAISDADNIVDEARIKQKVLAGPVGAYYYSSKNIDSSYSLSFWQPSDKIANKITCSNLYSDVDVNQKTGSVYWPSPSANLVLCTDPKGEESQHLFLGRSIDSIAIDSEENIIYFIEDKNKIMSAPLDGGTQPSKIVEINPPSATAPVNVMKLAIAKIGQNEIRFFWVNGEELMSYTKSSGIKTIIAKATGKAPVYIAIDEHRNLLYWYDFNQKAIFNSGLDGDNPKPLIQISGSNTIRGLSAEDSTGDLYYSCSSDTSTGGIYRWRCEDDHVRILKLDNALLSWGLALHLKPNSQVLADAIAYKMEKEIQAQKLRNDAIEKAATKKRSATNKVKSAENDASIFISLTNIAVEKAKQAKLLELTNAQKFHDLTIADAERRASQIIDLAKLAASETISKTQNTANQIIGAANNSLEQARRRLREVLG